MKWLTRKQMSYTYLQAIAISIVGIAENVVSLFTLGHVWPHWSMSVVIKFSKINLGKLQQRVG